MSVLLAMFSAIAQGMLWAMLALGVYITFPSSGLCRPYL